MVARTRGTAHRGEVNLPALTDGASGAPSTNGSAYLWQQPATPGGLPLAQHRLLLRASLLQPPCQRAWPGRGLSPPWCYHVAHGGRSA